MKNIYIIGAQCTGKTTLVNALRAFFNTSDTVTDDAALSPPKIVQEVARTVLCEEGYVAKDITSSPDRALELQKAILRAQNQAENDIPPGEWFISDRSCVDPLVYAKVYCKPEDAETLVNFTIRSSAIDRLHDALIILCETVPEWLEDDGVRLVPSNVDDWLRMDKVFRETLHELHVEFSTLDRTIKDLRHRVAFVVRQWKNE